MFSDNMGSSSDPFWQRQKDDTIKDFRIRAETAEKQLAVALQENDDLRRERDELEKLVYVPGVWKCAKCGCGLVSTNIHAESGKFSANTSPQQCPNDCGPMWRRTEREAGNELVDRLEKMLERAEKAEAEHDAAVRDLATIADMEGAEGITDAKFVEDALRIVHAALSPSSLARVKAMQEVAEAADRFRPVLKALRPWEATPAQLASLADYDDELPHLLREASKRLFDACEEYALTAAESAETGERG